MSVRGDNGMQAPQARFECGYCRMRMQWIKQLEPLGRRSQAGRAGANAAASLAACAQGRSQL